MAEEDTDLLDAIIDEMCDAIAEGAVNTAIDVMFSMCANAGQESIIGDCSDDFDQSDSISEGEFDEVESNHPEAVGEITDVGNEICSAAAEECKAIREAADLADLL